MSNETLSLFRKLILVFGFVLLATNVSAKTNVAYVLEDSSAVSQNVIDVFNQAGLTYDIIRDSKISSTDFSKYDVLFVAEYVTNTDKIPLNKMSAIFLDRKVAREVWNLGSSSTGATLGRNIEVYDAQSFVFNNTGVSAGSELTVYNSFPGFDLHYLNPPVPSKVKTAAIRADYFRPIIAYSTDAHDTYAIKNLFFGIKKSDYWNDNAKITFRNSLAWLLAELDKDGDGWPASQDCNDNNLSIYPGAIEIPYDGIDQNCDSIDLLDIDGDGYCRAGYSVTNAALQCPKETGNTGADCDDSNAGTNPSNQDPRFNCANDPPVFDEIPQLDFSEGEIVLIEVNATDPDIDELYYSINDSRFTKLGNGFFWQTNYGDEGAYKFEISVSDGEFRVKRIADVLIKDANRPPVQQSNIPDLVWKEDSAIIIDIREYFSDADGEELKFGIADRQTEENIAVNEEPDGVFTFVPKENYFGEEWITFYATDSKDQTKSNIVHLTVQNINDPVYFSGEIQNLSMNEDVSSENALNLYDYFYDIDSELSFKAIGNEKVNVAIENGLVSFYPAENFAGKEEIYFEASDGEFSASSNIFILEVVNQADLPIFENFSCDRDIKEDVSQECEINAFDIENNIITFEIKEEKNLNCEIEGNVLTYVSKENYFGDASCMIAASNVYGPTLENLAVNVLPVNDAPNMTSYSPTQNTVMIPNGFQKKFVVDAEDVDSEFSITWFVNGEQTLFTAPPHSELVLSKPAGVYNVEARASDSDLSTSVFWTAIFGPVNDFKCAELDGDICSERETCQNSFLDSKDSDRCCATACIPAFVGVNYCKSLNESVMIEIKAPEAGEEIVIGKTLESSLRITNSLPKEQKIKVEAYLYNLDKDKSEESTDETINIEGQRTLPLRFNLEIPTDLKSDASYALYIKASNEENSCNNIYQTLKITRPGEKIVISNFEIPAEVSCGDDINIKLKVENLGSEAQDVNLSIYSRALKINEISNFELGEFADDEDEKTQKFTFSLPDNIEPGDYEITATASYGTNLREKSTKEIKVECGKKITRESLESQANQINSPIILNQVIGQTKEKTKTNTLLTSLIISLFNLVLVSAIVLFLYSAKVNSKNKR